MSTTESIIRSTSDQDEPRPPLDESHTAEVEVLVEEISIDGMCGVY